MTQLSYQLSRYDLTREVYLWNPASVEMVIRSILDRLYGERYDAALLSLGIEAIVRAYRGRYPGLLRCDTLYHDLRHALETGLTMARLLDANASSSAPGSADYIDGSHALLGVLLALFHDVGLLRGETEAHLWGASLTPVHEERGVDFMSRFLAGTTLAPLAEKAELIMPTKLIFTMPDSWRPLERKLASLLASADLLSQLTDRFYIEKCWHFLFLEYSSFGLAGRPESVYPDRETLLAKTPDFYHKLVLPRLENEFGGVHRLFDTYFSDGNPFQKALQLNLSFLMRVLDTRDYSCMRRRPQPFIDK